MKCYQFAPYFRFLYRDFVLIHSVSLNVLVISPERMPEQSQTATVDETPKAVSKPNPEEYVAHEVVVVSPNAHPNSVPIQVGASTSPHLGLSAGLRLHNMSAASPTNVNSPIGPRQPQNNYGSGPSFLLVPKRRVWHNVRSNVKAIVPGRCPFFVPVLQSEIRDNMLILAKTLFS